MHIHIWYVYFVQKYCLSEQSAVLIFPRVPSNFVEKWNDSIPIDSIGRFRDTVRGRHCHEGTAAIFHGRGGTTRRNKYRRRKRAVAHTRLPNGHRRLPPPAVFDPWSKSPPSLPFHASLRLPKFLNFSPHSYLSGQSSARESFPGQVFDADGIWIMQIWFQVTSGRGCIRF